MSDDDDPPEAARCQTDGGPRWMSEGIDDRGNDVRNLRQPSEAEITPEDRELAHGALGEKISCNDPRQGISHDWACDEVAGVMAAARVAVERAMAEWRAALSANRALAAEVGTVHVELAGERTAHGAACRARDAWTAKCVEAEAAVKKLNEEVEELKRRLHVAGWAGG